MSILFWLFRCCVTEDGLEAATPQPPPSATEKTAPQAIDKSVIPPVNKNDSTAATGAPAAANKAASPQESRKQSVQPAVTGGAPADQGKRPTTADRPESQLTRPDSQLSRVKSPGGLSKSDVSCVINMLSFFLFCTSRFGSCVYYESSDKAYRTLQNFEHSWCLIVSNFSCGHVPKFLSR